MMLKQINGGSLVSPRFVFRLHAPQGLGTDGSPQSDTFRLDNQHVREKSGLINLVTVPLISSVGHKYKLLYPISALIEA
jgi:hypothetical protein